MTLRKGQSATNRKSRFDVVLAVLSGNPTPLRVPGLVAVLREAGYEIDDETPKKWGERGIPEKWARLIATLPRAQAAELTADWIRDGIGPGPRPRGTTPSGVAQAARSVGEGNRGGAPYAAGRGGVTAVAPLVSPDTDSRVTRLPGRRPAELEKLLGLVRDALLGAVNRALARDHELEQTRRGYRILGDAFLDLGLKLQANDVDTRELMTYARELQKMGDR